jgi:hypothetical protein
MKIWSSEHVFNHSWESVVKAALQKYPNPLTPSVRGVDVVERTIQDNVIKSHRLMMTEWSVAPWIRKLLGKLTFLNKKSCKGQGYFMLN